MGRFIFNLLLICQFGSGSFGYSLFTRPGPKFPPTKGQVWPAPQYEQKNGTVYYVLLPNLHVTVPNHTCGLLTDALERNNLILRDLDLLQNFNYLNQEVRDANEYHSNGFLKELKVVLTSECEKMPHYEMNENYKLTVTKISELRSESIWGILRGLETFVQLFYFPDDFSEIRINATTIVDYPQYKHRGLLIDTGRHYLSLSTIYKMVDALSMNKMNVLHWHIMDDQSFPYQSERFPTLSEKGAYHPSMVYTKADIRSVVAFARDRGIRVIPEIDVPENNIDSEILAVMSTTDLKELIPKIRDRIKIRNYIEKFTQNLTFALQQDFKHMYPGKDNSLSSMLDLKKEEIIEYAKKAQQTRDKHCSATILQLIGLIQGHTRSWGEAFPQILTECYERNKVVGLGPLDPTKNETYAILKQLFQEVHTWFPDEFLHIGGDEVQIKCWNSNPYIRKYLKKNNINIDQLQRHFMLRTLKRLPNEARPIVWQEVFDQNAIIEQKTHVQVWNYGWISEMDKILKAGHYVIFSASWYLDYHNMPWEDFYKADPRQMVYINRGSDIGLEDIVGGEACIWGELADDTNILSKTWPRTSAIAERLWTGLDYKNAPPQLVNDTVRSRIEEHTCRMNRRGIPAQPPNGPGFCIGAAPPLPETYYEVYKV